MKGIRHRKTGFKLRNFVYDACARVSRFNRQKKKNVIVELSEMVCKLRLSLMILRRRIV